jgi:hypothetical protein
VFGNPKAERTIGSGALLQSVSLGKMKRTHPLQRTGPLFCKEFIMRSVKNPATAGMPFAGIFIKKRLPIIFCG